jgi:hypothetical protein
VAGWPAPCAPTRMATTEDSPSKSYQAVYHHESGMATIGTAASPPTSRYHHQILAPTPTQSARHSTG